MRATGTLKRRTQRHAWLAGPKSGDLTETEDAYRRSAKHSFDEHPVMRSIMLGDTWDWCYVHEVMGRLG